MGLRLPENSQNPMFGERRAGPRAALIARPRLFSLKTAPAISRYSPAYTCMRWRLCSVTYSLSSASSVTDTGPQNIGSVWDAV